LLEAQQPDLLVSDICMPGASGLDLLTYAHEHVPRCKVILVTGNSARAGVSQALLLGAFDYLEKPLNLTDLVSVARKAVRQEAAPLLSRAAAAMAAGTQVRQAALGTVGALVRAVEAKDPYTRRHSEQVTHYAVNLAQTMGLAAPLVESIRVAAMLHDVGKIGVPDHVLTKAGRLTRADFGHIRRHPALGADILANITMFGPEARLVRFHHERWDGQGYPDGLAGENIPLGARIIGLADAIDAMLMERTYKMGYSTERMLKELARCSGTQFDPAIAATAATWCRANPDKLILPRRQVAPQSVSAPQVQSPGVLAPPEPASEPPRQRALSDLRPRIAGDSTGAMTQPLWPTGFLPLPDREEQI
jgi:response regulator RpfG family c-di-GMP phosphodiesterase